MVEQQKLGSIKKFGARYGRTTKQRFGKIEKEQRRFHKCPYCYNIKVKRIAVGIWYCRKCKAKFAGKAYSTKEKIITRKEKLEEPIEQPKESG